MDTPTAEVEVLEPEETEVEQRSTLGTKSENVLSKAKDFVIDTAEKYEAADEMVSRGKGIIKDFESWINPHIDRANKTHKSLCAGRKLFTDPLNKATKLLGDNMAIYRKEQKAKAKAEQEKAAKEAREKEEAALLEKSVRLEAEGNKEEAQKVLEKGIENPMTAPAPVTQNFIPKTKTGFRTDWISTITDPELVPKEYRVIDEAKIQKMVRAAEGNIKIPGVGIEEIEIPIRKG